MKFALWSAVYPFPEIMMYFKHIFLKPLLMYLYGYGMQLFSSEYNSYSMFFLLIDLCSLSFNKTQHLVSMYSFKVPIYLFS